MSRSNFIDYDRIIEIRQYNNEVKEFQGSISRLMDTWADYRGIDYPPTQKHIDQQDQRNFERLVSDWKRLSNRVRWMEKVLVELTLNSDLYIPKP